ncbi:MAG: zinc-binding dehydrogenase [Bacteroidia bacterium]|nr:zinc-binding dehydrogenase [Bacteroidia bacterium]MDW8133560.1 zinc-binding dehydrogenase [Bacteroidia bacterium]
MRAWVLYHSLPKDSTPDKEKMWEGALRWEEVPLPALQASHVRVRVKAAALNRRDLWIALGLYPAIQYPAILGSDGCGEVVEVGSPTLSHLKGKRIIINPALDWGASEKAQQDSFHILGMPTHGTLAEFVDVPAENIHAAPEFLSDEEAAAIPLAGLTAYRALFVQGELQPGMRVLITGIGGGVAIWALQLAVAAEAEVWVTSSSPEKIEKAQKLGAKDGVIYAQEGWSKLLSQQAGTFDLIVDGTGGEFFSEYISLVSPGGKIVVYGATRGNPSKIDLRRLFWRQICIVGSTMGSPQNFASLLEFIKQKQIRPFLEHVMPINALPDALTRLWKGEQIGKIVLYQNSL